MDNEQSQLDYIRQMLECGAMTRHEARELAGITIEMIVNSQMMDLKLALGITGENNGE